MSTMLDAVSLEDWREVVSGALQAAKNGDPQARNWLAQYLIGRPDAKAPTPLTVVVQQLNGVDPVVDELVKPMFDQQRFPILHQNDEWEQNVRALVAVELAEKFGQNEKPKKSRSALSED